MFFPKEFPKPWNIFFILCTCLHNILFCLDKILSCLHIYVLICWVHSWELVFSVEMGHNLSFLSTSCPSWGSLCASFVVKKILSPLWRDLKFDFGTFTRVVFKSRSVLQHWLRKSFNLCLHTKVYTCLSSSVNHLKYLAAMLDDLSSVQTFLCVRLQPCTCSRQEPCKLYFNGSSTGLGGPTLSYRRLWVWPKEKAVVFYPNWSTVTKQFQQRLDCNNLEALG